MGSLQYQLLCVHTIVFQMITFCIVGCGGHKITELVVPTMADPRENATLVCRFDMERDYLYSMKWYKDDREIFRFMPSQNPTTTTYDQEGLKHIDSECTQWWCTVNLQVLTQVAAGHYRCEVSTEAPTFRIVNRNATMLVAAMPREDPVISGVPDSAGLGNTLKLNCTTDVSLPLAEIIWYINGKKAPNLFLKGEQFFHDNNGLISTKKPIQFQIQKSHFENPDGLLTLRCEAFMPRWLPVSKLNRSTTVRIPQQSKNIVLSWFISGATHLECFHHLILFMTILICIVTNKVLIHQYLSAG